MDIIKIEIPSNPHYLQMLRLSTASFANKIGFDIESIEDLKVLVSEIFTLLMPNNEKINIKFILNDRSMKILFNDIKSISEEGMNDANSEIKKQILQALADEVIFSENEIEVIYNG